MTINAALFSSATDNWATPQDFYDELHREFDFTLDPCADTKNAKCQKYYTEEQNGLKQNWGKNRIFCNPPYGRAVGDWAEKSYKASQGGALVVFLVPARTDTKWFHNWVYGKAELRFVKGRLKFGNSQNSAPFPSLVAVYRP